MGKIIRNCRGFTLVEMMVVISIFAILAGISTPLAGRRMRDYRMNAAARDLQSVVQGARMEAIKRGADVGVSLNLAGDRCTTFVDDGVNPLVLDAGDTVIGTMTAPDGVDLYATASGGTMIQFSSRGTLSFPAGTERIQMQNVDGLFRGVNIRITGNSTIVSSADNGATWL